MLIMSFMQAAMLSCTVTVIVKMAKIALEYDSQTIF